MALGFWSSDVGPPTLTEMCRWVEDFFLRKMFLCPCWMESRWTTMSLSYVAIRRSDMCRWVEAFFRHWPFLSIFAAMSPKKNSDQKKGGYSKEEPKPNNPEEEEEQLWMFLLMCHPHQPIHQSLARASFRLWRWMMTPSASGWRKTALIPYLTRAMLWWILRSRCSNVWSPSSSQWRRLEWKSATHWQSRRRKRLWPRRRRSRTKQT